MNVSRAFEQLLLGLLSPSGSRARLVILTFHRVLRAPDPLLPGEPDVHRFEQILRWLSDLCHVLPLEDAVTRLHQGTLPARAAAITFDDGYRNNLELAKPALQAAGLPATVFVARDPLRRGIMWNDLVIEAVRNFSGCLDLQDLGLGTFDAAGDDRGACIRDLIGVLKYRDRGERDELSNELYRRAAGTEPPRQMLTEDEALDLQGDGISLGAHTLSHPILARLTDDLAFEEIEGSRRWLGALTGRLPMLFAYPNGRLGDDYESRHAEMVRASGFSAAVSTRWGAANQGSPVFELPRFTPWEQARPGFVSRILKTCVRSYAE